MWPSFILCDPGWCVQNCTAERCKGKKKSRSIRRNRRCGGTVRFDIPAAIVASRESRQSRKRRALLCIGVRSYCAPALVHMSALVLLLAWRQVVVSVSAASVTWKTDSIQLSVSSTSDTYSLGLTASRYTIYYRVETTRDAASHCCIESHHRITPFFLSPGARKCWDCGTN